MQVGYREGCTQNNPLSLKYMLLLYRLDDLCISTLVKVTFPPLSTSSRIVVAEPRKLEDIVSTRKFSIPQYFCYCLVTILILVSLRASSTLLLSHSNRSCLDSGVCTIPSLLYDALD